LVLTCFTFTERSGSLTPLLTVAGTGVVKVVVGETSAALPDPVEGIPEIPISGIMSAQCQQVNTVYYFLRNNGAHDRT
jgi:hypothetical protein